MKFEEFFFNYSASELFRRDGFVREFYSGSRKIHILVDRAFLIRKLYLMNFVEQDVVWLVIPGSSLSCFVPTGIGGP